MVCFEQSFPLSELRWIDDFASDRGCRGHVGITKIHFRAGVPGSTAEVAVDGGDAHLAVSKRTVMTCACRKSNPDILVMQPAQDRTAKNVTNGSDGARHGGVLI